MITPFWMTDLATGLPVWFVGSVVVILGLAIGSFTTCVVYRVPRGLSIWRNSHAHHQQRSFCPSCKHPLGAQDLVPVFSWLMQKGKCRYCKASIGWTYPLIELATLLCVLGLYGGGGFTPVFLVLVFCLPALVGLASILIKKRRAL